MVSDLDTEAIQLYALSVKRDRLLDLASKPRRRSDFVHAMLHDRRSLNDKVLRPILPTAVSGQTVLPLLGVPANAQAYCIAAMSNLDGQVVPLEAALAALVGKMDDVLIHCVGRRVAYYENHEGEQFVAKVR